jgi:hypothetical protein
MYEDAILIFIDVASVHERAWNHVCLLDVHLRHIVIVDVGLVTICPQVDRLHGRCTTSTPYRDCNVDVLHTCLPESLGEVLPEAKEGGIAIRVLPTPTLVSVRTLQAVRTCTVLISSTDATS